MSAPFSEHLIGPDLRTQASVFVRGEGVELIDGQGRRYLDAASGVGVTSLGYSAGEVVDAMREQAATLPYLHAMRFEAPPAQQLADLVASVLPGDLGQIFFASGGSEANESVIKFVRQYWLERGQPERWKAIGRRSSFHREHAGHPVGRLARGSTPAARPATAADAAHRHAEQLPGLRALPPGGWRGALHAGVRGRA
jgi:adenosylmethionine-8-amino-7-oxononanoate aminotransferase